MKIALAQIAPEYGNLEANLAKHLAYIQQAVDAQADLIVFPELSLTGDTTDPAHRDVSLSLDSDIVLKISEASHQIDIVVGLIERSRTNLYNRYNAAFYLSDEVLLQRHRKLFLVNYATFEEAKHYVPGNNLQAFDTQFGRVCMLICNDAWHAAAPYIAALDSAELLIVPANSARDTLNDHLNIPATWEHMNRAYSAMMGFYTVFVNRVGVRDTVYGDFPYWGGSEIIGPNGEVIVKAPYDQEALVFAEIAAGRVAEQRFNAPILRDARLWLLRQEIDRLAAERSEDVLLDGEPPDPGR